MTSGLVLYHGIPVLYVWTNGDGCMPPNGGQWCTGWILVTIERWLFSLEPSISTRTSTRNRLRSCPSEHKTQFSQSYQFVFEPALSLLTPSENGLWGFRRGEVKIGAPPASSVNFWLNLETAPFYLSFFSLCTSI